MVVSCTPDLEFVVKVTPAFFIAKEEVLVDTNAIIENARSTYISMGGGSKANDVRNCAASS